ncbi:MAG: hypothetical protein ACPG45_00730 [Flavobacteriaceae bacterium]
MKYVYLMLLVLCVSCSLDDEQQSSQELRVGKVVGKVVLNNSSSVARALIFHDSNGEISYTYSDTNGDFELTIPAGEGELHIQTGDGKLFRTVSTVTIAEDDVLDLTGDARLTLTQQANIGYLAGAFDSIQDLVTEMGYSISEVTVADLGSADLYDQYDAIFLNCDLATFDDATNANMINYVAQGGSLYASDFAIGYYLGEDNFTGADCGDRPGGFIDDATICTEKTGQRPALYDSPVLSEEYQTVLGKTEMDIDSGVWTIVHEIDTNFWEVLVEDTLGTPLVIKTNSVTSPNVTPLNDANGNWVTLCHIPPGNPNNPITITVSAAAADAHLAHGDSLGECGSAQSGSVYYTTFENHQSGPSAIADVKKILEHIILSL